MSYTADQILSFALDFERTTSESLVKSAKKKEDKKSTKKEDKASSDKNKASAKEKDSKKKKPLPKKKSFITEFDNLIAKFAQMSQNQLGGAGSEEMIASDQLPPGTLDEIKVIVSLLNTSGTPKSKANANNLNPFTVADPNRKFNLIHLLNGLQNAARSLHADKDYDGQAQAQALYKKLLGMKSTQATTPGGTTPGAGANAGKGGFGGQPGSGATGPAGATKPHVAVKPREDVANAQRKLNNFIMTGKLQSKILDPDGKMGPLTRAVLKEYKDSLGLPSFTDEQMIVALNKAPESTPTGGPATNQNQVAQTWATPAADPAAQSVAQNTPKPPDFGF